MNKIDEIFNIVNGIQESRDIPEEAKKIAKDNNIIVIVAGSDDLMYCYGVDSWLTDYCEHNYGWDGDDLIDISDEKLEFEAEQIGLEIYWCGQILKINKSIPDYDVDKNGSFFYKVKEGINFKNFIVYTHGSNEEISHTGIIIELPDNFKSSLARS